jgi:putative endonuclease
VAAEGTARAGRAARPLRKDALGRYGEDVAAAHLEADGFVVLARNWRCDQGELDIVAREGRVLVVCEVKTRSGVTHGSPFEAVTQRKLHRLERLGIRWLRENSVRPAAMRIDVLTVLRTVDGRMIVEHVRGLR